MLSTVFKAYDVRATCPDPLSESVAFRIGYGTAKFLLDQEGLESLPERSRRLIAVGHDMRLTSPAMVGALQNGVRAAGGDVLDVGLVDTPFVPFAVNHAQCIGGVQTTASHNPANYNGFKISKMFGKPVGEQTGLVEIRHIAEAAETSGDLIGGRTEVDLWEAYRAHVHPMLSDGLRSGAETIRVAIDASNGMAGTMVPKVFTDVPGIEIVAINFENSSGVFVHEPNPLVEANLSQVREATVAEGCQVGICFDGDADRCMVVDEQGGIVGCDLITGWLGQRFLKAAGGGSVVFDLRSSRSTGEMVREAGGEPVMGRVGHVFMKQAMAEHEAVFGGELSGHFYFAENFNADSGAMAFAAVCSAVTEDGRPLSEIITAARRYCQSGEINFEVDDKAAAMERLVAAFPDAEVLRLDGVTVDLGNWWCNVRPSNTEPLLRLNLEAANEQEVSEHLSDVAPLLGTQVDH
ncbi:MAG: phosphomannomutase/phosphoglucomutase [Phycisphaerales bacterium]|nr:phosphomannomutase/phosphoglucomutase [Phycisphaerales bacterium]